MDRPSASKHDALTGPDAKARRLRLARQVQDERRSARAVEREGVLENQVEDDLVVARVHVRSDMGSGGLVQVDRVELGTTANPLPCRLPRAAGG